MRLIRERTSLALVAILVVGGHGALWDRPHAVALERSSSLKGDS